MSHCGSTEHGRRWHGDRDDDAIEMAMEDDDAIEMAMEVLGIGMGMAIGLEMRWL